MNIIHTVYVYHLKLFLIRNSILSSKGVIKGHQRSFDDDGKLLLLFEGSNVCSRTKNIN